MNDQVGKKIMAQAATKNKQTHKINVEIIVNDDKSYMLEDFDISSKVSQVIKNINDVSNMKMSLNTHEMRYDNLPSNI